MRWLGTFNVLYGAAGLIAALYLGRGDAVVLCLWVMASGLVMRTARVRSLLRRMTGRVPLIGRHP